MYNILLCNNSLLSLQLTPVISTTPTIPCPVSQKYPMDSITNTPPLTTFIPSSLSTPKLDHVAYHSDHYPAWTIKPFPSSLFFSYYLQEDQSLPGKTPSSVPVARLIYLVEQKYITVSTGCMLNSKSLILSIILLEHYQMISLFPN